MVIKKVLLVTLLLLNSLSIFAEGIRSAEELIAFSNALNAGQSIQKWKNNDGVVCLDSDIDMSKVKKFPSISSFGGVFDGQGHAILNWKAKSALFDKVLYGGIVRNLKIDSSCSMKAVSKGGEYFLGFIANTNNGLIENCENNAPLTHKSTFSDQSIYVGGLVGSNRWLIINCRNTGNITSDCVSSVQSGELMVSLGGIAGGGYSKSEPASNISWSENTGKISYGGDMPNVRVGGIIGDSFYASIKYCINRGDVKVYTSPGEPPYNGASVSVGGICSYIKTDVAGCDNFGKIISEGSHSAALGGVIGTPHRSLVIADCANYGDVVLSNTVPSSVGGVVGSIGREVHLCNCTNYGNVKYDGFSPDRPSNVGGVVGQIYAKNDARQGAYLRRCVNYGTVQSGSGGNNYENNRAIHTGGVAGRVAGAGWESVMLKDCENRGKVESVSGKKGSLAGGLYKAEAYGEFYDNIASPAEISPDGANIFGRVVSTRGVPIPGVVVSDGVQCVQTGVDGSYYIRGDLNKSRFVFISLPSGYEIPQLGSIPQNFFRIPRGEKAVKADFVLHKREHTSDEYTMIMIGDPQMRGLGYDESGERFRDVVIPDIEQFKAGRDNVYAINLGDLVYNWMYGYDDYVDICSRASFPIFNVIGNHDFEQNTLYSTELGTPFFENYISPIYYSFNIGKIHYIFLNDIMYDRMDPTARYSYGLDEDQMTWLENDLKFVPKDRTIVVCAHAQLFKKANGDTIESSHSMAYRNYNRYRDLLTSYRKVYSWSGHYHDNYGYDYAGKGFEKMDSVVCVSVARCNGALRTNKELNSDGTPNGYMVVSVDGDDMKWYYKTVGKGQDYQMRVYSPVRTNSNYVKAIIWNYSEGFWTKPEWWENGVKVAELEVSPENDPDYVEIFNSLGDLSGRAKAYAAPVESKFMFKVKPSPGVRKGEVKVTDNFGTTYSQTIEW